MPSSLPPKVLGELIGTLTIRLLSINCREHEVLARVQFWGETNFSDLCLSKEDESSPSVEYPLVGSIHTLCSYLQDASPLKVTFFRQSTNHQPTETGQPEIIGYAYIQDLCINDFLPSLNAQQGNAQKSIKFVLRRESQITGHEHVVGEASFELHFRVLVCPNTAIAPLYTTDTGSVAQVAPPPLLRQSTIPLPAPNPPPSEKCAIVNNNICAADDSSRQPSDIGGMGSSILEDLLELCCDDMTIPTVDSSIPCVDPYELWISRMIASANSPATTEFPSLLSAGSNQSHNLQKVTEMKLEVTGVTLSARITNKLCDPENVFVLQYSNPPLAFDKSKAVATTTNSIVCDGLDRQSKVTMMAAGKSKSTQVKPPSTGGISLMKSTYVKHMDMEFKNDDNVRLWLDGIMEFSLCYRASESKLPRVARLVGKGKETVPNPKSGITCCVAKALLSLRDVILSESFSFHAKLPLLLLAESVHGEAGKRVGTVSVHVALSFAEDEKVGVSTTSSSPAAATDETQVLMKVRPTLPMTSAHHPISVLLSNFVGASNNKDAVAIMPQPNAVPPLGVLESHQSSLSTKQTHEYDTPPLSVKAPSIWIDIRVENISKLVVDIVKGNSGCFKLGMSCSKPQTQSEIETFGPQEIYTLTTNTFDDTHRHGAICSWKVPLDAENNCDKYTTVILHLWYCDNGSSSIQRLVGLTTIPFLLEPVESSEEKICSWLPGIVANSAFDLLDPKTHKSIGTIDVLVAAGMLRQVRALSAVCKSARILQQWWRRFRASIAAVKETQQNSVDTHPPSRENDQQEDYDPEFDTIHAGFISQDVRCLRGQLREAVSSPDSLFDEWSQQSISTISGYNVCSSFYEQGPAISANLPEVRTGICLASSAASSDIDESIAKDSPQSGEEQLPEGEEIQNSLAEESLAAESPQDDEQDSDSDCKNLTTEVESTTAGEHNIIHTRDDENESTKVSPIPPIPQMQVMSTLKPMNLETSFAREQLDPPEEMKHEYRPSPSGKRLSTNDEQRDNKRNRVMEFTDYYPRRMYADSVNHSSTPVNTQETSEESETVISSGETCYDECDESSDADDAISYRSIGSMIGSLDNINSRLVARGAEPATKFYASYALVNSSMDENKRRKDDPPEIEYDASTLSSQQSKPVCPGRQIEPTEENFVSRTPIAQQNSCGDDGAVNTSEKGTSPMSTPIVSNDAASTSKGIEEAHMLSDQDLPAATRHVRLRKSADRSPLEALMHHYQTTDRRRNCSERPNYRGLFHCLGNHISESVLSPPPRRDVTILPRFDTFTQGPNPQKAGQVLLEAKHDKTFDKMRLERIFEGR